MANGTQDKVQELQDKLYQAAKLSPTRRFHALYDKVCRADFLWRAWLLRSSSRLPSWPTTRGKASLEQGATTWLAMAKAI